MKKVKIIPIAQRAKNRVREHGEVMELLTEATYQSQRAILVKSLGLTWRNQRWLGWIDREEADWEVLDEDAG